MPQAYFLDEYGFKRNVPYHDWRIDSVSDTELRISNISTSHFVILAKDHIYNYTSDTSKAAYGVQRGFLTLRIQLFIQGINVSMQPNFQPGSPVEPPEINIIPKAVDLHYPADSGLQEKLTNEGFELVWSREEHVSRRMDFEGWEQVIEQDQTGTLTTFYVPGRDTNQILMKRKKG